MLAQIVQIITERGAYQGPSPSAFPTPWPTMPVSTDPWWSWALLGLAVAFTLTMVIYFHWRKSR
jgi:hypothetical protein